MQAIRSIAIDVAILLSDQIRNHVARLNAALLAPPEGFRFDETHLPHVTLAQLFIRIDKLGRLFDVVGAVLNDHPLLELRGTEVIRGNTTSVLRVPETPLLGQLHRRLMKRLYPLDERDGNQDAFVLKDAPPRDTDLEWVRQFRDASANERFEPHITLGVGRLIAPIKPVSFIASRVAVCQLGRFCTCRRILADWMLSDQLEKIDPTDKI